MIFSRLRRNPRPGRISVLAALALFLLPAAALPSPAEVTPEDLERAVGLRARHERLVSGLIEDVRWIDAGSFVYRNRIRGGYEFVRFDAAGGVKRPAFDHARMAAAYTQATGIPCTPSTLPFNAFRFVDDGRAVEIRSWRSFGTVWRCGLSDYVFTKVAADSTALRTGGRPPHVDEANPTRDLSIPLNPNPIPSPDGRREALIRNFNVVVRSAGGTDVVVLSTDGSEGDFYDPETLVWSPDSKKIAVFRIRPGYQRRVEYILSSPADQIQPKRMSLFYPKPGDAVDVRRPVLFNVETGRRIVVPSDLFPNAYALTDLFWREDSRAFTFEYNQRGHAVYRIIEVDGTTGLPRALISEEPGTFFNTYAAATGPKDSGTYFRRDVNDGREILWISERDGWKHLYLYDGRTGRVKNQITRGEWVVRGVVDVDEKTRQIWFVAGGIHPGEDPYFRHLCRVDFDGTNLTPLTRPGMDHSVFLSPDRRLFVDIASRVDLPSVTTLRRADNGAVVFPLEQGDISSLRAEGWRAPESFTAKGRDGKTDIWGVILRPSHFDPGKKYPVIENIYAGPHGSHVPKSFNWFAPHSGGDSLVGMQSLAELGFIVVQIDGMGTANRSKAFHDVCWKNLADAGFPDRILWHKAAAAKYPFYDLSRGVGIYGGSAGGQNALGALLFHPEFYTAAVAFNGCHDNRMDKISWNEQWMGWPIGPEYSASSNVDNAWRLQGRLLLVSGELDTNVDPSSTLQVVSALIKAGKMFDLLVIPNGGHGAGRSSEFQAYGDRKRFEFFVRHLLGQEPPDGR